MRKLLTFITVVSILCFSACKKSSSSSTALTMQNLAGTYMLTAMTGKDSANNTIDIYNFFLPPCEKDDKYQLNADGSYVITDAGVQCSPANTSSGTWTLSGNAISAGTLSGTIQKYDGKTLIVTGAQSLSGFNLLVTSTFTKQ